MPTLTVPEAKQQVTAASAPFMVVAAHVFERVRQGERPPADDASIETVARLIRAADAYADAIATQSSDVQSRYHDETVMIAGLRRLAMIIMADINSDQAWFWTEEWQAGEREIDARIAAGRTIRHASTEEFLVSLETT
ncbi:MAG TPA: hypothetical protein VFU48_00610 [Nitrospira sp.]|nr:hypothetical protein [Nitrospira sp.]